MSTESEGEEPGHQRNEAAARLVVDRAAPPHLVLRAVDRVTDRPAAALTDPHQAAALGVLFARDVLGPRIAVEVVTLDAPLDAAALGGAGPVGRSDVGARGRGCEDPEGEAECEREEGCLTRRHHGSWYAPAARRARQHERPDPARAVSRASVRGSSTSAHSSSTDPGPERLASPGASKPGPRRAVARDCARRGLVRARHLGYPPDPWTRSCRARRRSRRMRCAS